MLSFDEVNEVVTSFCKARSIPYESLSLAISPEEVYDDLASFYLATGDVHAKTVSELLRKYLIQA